ncbi:MAG: tRNA pseudouridine(38-40) synthase TruA [Actinomycetota bacterium]
MRPRDQARLNLRLDLAYHGAPFRGWQRQPQVKTVQGELEAALAKVLKQEVSTTAAGRTDAGVHALGQVVSCESPEVPDPDKLRQSLNGICAPAIAIHSCSPASDDFNARFSARSRTYVYAVLEGEVPDPFLSGTSLHHPRILDLAAMNEAAGHLIGAQDFSSFGRVLDPVDDKPPASAERVLFELRCRRDGNLVRIKARANSFIQQMVRSLVGTLLQVGEGRRDPGEMHRILAAKNRAAAGPVASPHGLCLVAVEYDEGFSTR